MSSQGKGRLTVIGGPDSGKKIVFTERARVGRDAQFELEISDSDTGVHRSPHFVIVNRHGEFRLVSEYESDTRVNGQIVQTARLRSGDVIQIGFRTLIRFEDEETIDVGLHNGCEPPTDLNG
jgi:predicted component of type VI protein secretion system